MKAQLQKGDRVLVYEDPVSEEKPEGVAILIRKLQDIDPGFMEYWEVVFVGERERYHRAIQGQGRANLEYDRSSRITTKKESL